MPDTAPITAILPSSVGRAAFIEDVLFERGLLTAQQLSFVKAESKRRQEPSESVILQMGWVNEENLESAKGQVIGVAYIAPDKNPIAPEVLAYLPESVAKRFTVIPIVKEGSTLTVAMVDPLDLQVLEFIEKKTGMAIRPYIATAPSILAAISEQYTRGLSFEVGEALKEASPGITAPVIAQASVTGVLGEAPVAR